MTCRDCTGELVLLVISGSHVRVAGRRLPSIALTLASLC